MMEEETKKEISTLSFKPCLAVCIIGDDPASHLYVSSKRKACERVGVLSLCSNLDKSVPNKEVLSLIDSWNKDTKIHGILVQLPLPNHLDRYEILNRVSPNKDVDSFHPFNIGNIVHGQDDLASCTPKGVMRILDHLQVPIKGKHFVIINNSIVLGQPLCILLSNQQATVTMCNKDTENLKEISRSADVIVTAVGRRPNFVITKEYCKKDVVIIDVAINKIDGKICGDVDIDSVSSTASLVTKVPGSVGPVTIQVLLQNVLMLAKKQKTPSRNIFLTYQG